MKLVILEFSNTQPIAKIVDPTIGLVVSSMDEIQANQKHLIAKTDEIFRNAVERRMKKCLEGLTNAKRINPVNSITILYKDGEFNTTSYEAMVAALSLDTTEKWDVRQWQQCLKALNEFQKELIAEYGTKDYNYAFGVATEYMCMAS